MFRAAPLAVLGLLVAVLAAFADLAPHHLGPTPKWPRTPQDGWEAQPPLPQTIDVAVQVKKGNDQATILRLGRSFQDALQQNSMPQRGAFQWGPGPSTLMTGVCLSLGFALAGLWLVRGRPRRFLSLPVLAVVGLGTLSLLGCIWDRQTRAYDSPPRLQYAGNGELYGDALLEVDAKAGNCLILHQEALSELADKAGLHAKEGKGQ